MEEVHLTTIKPKNNVLLLAQEISFAKVLACNDKRLRDRGVRRLKKWFMTRSQGSMEFTKDDFMRIWKGLFYCMWMSDKPLIQEDLAEEISKLIHSFATFDASILFIETFFASLSIEWFGIDQLRLDKYLMLVRRFVRQSLALVAKLRWAEAEVSRLCDVYERTLATAPMGLSMHITEVFCEELAKVGNGELSSSTILQFITVFARVLAKLKDGRMISQITKYVFLHLMRQTELGIEHQMKEHAWKQCGFPGGDVDAAERVEVDSDEEEVEDEDVEDSEDEEWREEGQEVGPDARAGRVDVLLPPLDFDVRELLAVLRELRNKRETTTKARKTLIQLITKYENLAAGKYPLGLHKVDLPNKVDKKKEIAQAAKRLLQEEEKLKREEDGEMEIGNNKKKKKKVLKQKSSVWEVSEANESSENYDSEANSSWEVSEAENDSSNKNRPHKKKRKLGEEEKNKTANNPPKKLKNSQFSVSERKEKSTPSPKTSTPTTKSEQPAGSDVLESNPEKLSPSTPGEKTPKKKSKINSSNKTSTENDKKTDEIGTPLSKNQSKKNLKKKSKSKLRSDEIQSPEIDSTTNTADLVSSEEKGAEETSCNLQLNTSTTDKNNGWGGEWEESAEDTEYEIFIPNKKYVEKRKSLGLPFPVSSFVQKSAEKLTPVNKLKRELQNKSATPGSNKKVEFNLSANRAQEYKEYAKKLKTCKNQLAFDASKKPVQGLLKNFTPSPINPFYKKKLKFLKNSPSSC